MYLPFPPSPAEQTDARENIELRLRAVTKPCAQKWRFAGFEAQTTLPQNQFAFNQENLDLLRKNAQITRYFVDFRSNQLQRLSGRTIHKQTWLHN